MIASISDYRQLYCLSKMTESPGLICWKSAKHNCSIQNALFKSKNKIKSTSSQMVKSPTVQALEIMRIQQWLSKARKASSLIMQLFHYSLQSSHSTTPSSVVVLSRSRIMEHNGGKVHQKTTFFSPKSNLEDHIAVKCFHISGIPR